jgi:hypothetical protein
MDDHKKMLMRCYSEASARLRKRHDDEFHAILAEVYEENGVDVRKRMSRKAAARKRVEEARAIIEAADLSS